MPPVRTEITGLCDAAAIKRALRTRGTSLSGWARTHGYEPRTVRLAVQRWAGRTDRTPHGGLSRRIMAQLTTELGEARPGGAA